MKPQWEKRVELTIVIYQYLLLEYSLEEAIAIANDEFDVDAEMMSVLENVIQNNNEYVELVKPILKDTWTWERMSFFDRAIILEAIAEAKTLATPRTVLIDQALITARKYNIDNTYKYINSILDKII